MVRRSCGRGSITLCCNDGRLEVGGVAVDYMMLRCYLVDHIMLCCCLLNCGLVDHAMLRQCHVMLHCYLVDHYDVMFHCHRHCVAYPALAVG